MLHLRRAQKLTQAALADRVGVSKVYISQIENGHRTPSMLVVGRIADALGTSGMALLLGEDVASTGQVRTPEPGPAAVPQGGRAVRRPKRIEVRHGSRCAICGLDPVAVYGEFGLALLVAHHVRPAARSSPSRRRTETTTRGRDEPVDVTPANSVLLCHNCHHLVHVLDRTTGGAERLLEEARRIVHRRASPDDPSKR